MSVTVISKDFIHYEALGRGKPVIFVHGWLGSWRYWWPTMQALSKQYRVFAYDLWGYGNSSKISTKYSFEAYLDLLAQFIDRLGISAPLILIGHDLGAAIALRYSRLFPGQVDRLVTVAMPISGDTINESLTNGNLQSFVSRQLEKLSLPGELKQEVGKTDLEAISAVARQLIHYDFSADLVEIACPVLLIFGDRDPIIRMPDSSNGFLPKLNEFRHVITLEGCSHYPMLEQPAIFNRLIQDFVQGGAEITDIAPKEYWQRRTR